jgi:hypothetical protein
VILALDNSIQGLFPVPLGAQVLYILLNDRRILPQLLFLDSNANGKAVKHVTSFYATKLSKFCICAYRWLF